LIRKYNLPRTQALVCKYYYYAIVESSDLYISSVPIINA